ALEVLVARGVRVFVAAAGGYTPTPVISHAILTTNRGRKDGLADGIVVTPSHNPPEDGGFKYNPPNGGPADAAATGWVERRANGLPAAGVAGIRRVPYERASRAPEVQERDYIGPYVEDLGGAIDMDALRGAKIRVGADPLGGSNVAFWAPIAARWGI